MFERIIQLQARARPDEPAVITPEGVVSYRALEDHIRRFVWRLRSDVAAGDTVAVALDTPFLHQVARMAIVRLGATTVSVLGPARDSRLEIVSPDVVLWDPRQGAAPANSLIVDEGWTHLAAPSDEQLAPDQLVEGAKSMLLSSATTGLPKRILLARKALDVRLDLLSKAVGAKPGVRILSTMGLDTAGGSGAPYVAFLNGGAWVTSVELLHRPPKDPQLAPTLLTASPAQLNDMVVAAEDRELSLTGLTAWVVGAALSPRLSDRAERVLGCRVNGAYGSTEAGTNAGAPAELLKAHEGAAGFVHPWATIEIVGETDEALPVGDIGKVRLRSPGMATEYVGDAELSRQVFRGGWFYPGDIGAFASDGMLRILGRTGEFLNVGGKKVAYLSLEEEAIATAGVVDAGACEIRNPMGVAKAWLGLVVTSAFRSSDLSARLQRRFGRMHVFAIEVPAIPRNAMGKILRKDLARVVTEARASRLAAPSR